MDHAHITTAFVLLLYAMKLVISQTLIMQCDVKRCVTCISNNFRYLDEEATRKLHQKTCFVNLSDLCNAIKKIPHKILCRRRFRFRRFSRHLSSNVCYLICINAFIHSSTSGNNADVTRNDFYRRFSSQQSLRRELSRVTGPSQ